MPTMKTIMEDVKFVMKNASEEEANDFLKFVDNIVNRKVYCIIKCDQYIDIGNSIFCTDINKAIELADKKFKIVADQQCFDTNETINTPDANYYFCEVIFFKNSGWIPYMEIQDKGKNIGFFVGDNGNIPMIFSNRDDAEKIACNQRDKFIKDKFCKDAKFMIYPVKIVDL